MIFNKKILIMERTKNKIGNNLGDRKSWKKVGGGDARLVINGRNRIIKPNEVFDAFEDEVPSAFRDVIICLNGNVSGKPTNKPETIVNVDVTPITYTKEATEVEGLFNIKNSLGKIVNQKPITEEKADQFINDLSS